MPNKGEKRLLSERGGRCRNQHKSFKQEILKRDGYVCQVCGAKATEIDHIIPFKVCKETKADNCRAICHSCNCFLRSYPGFRGSMPRLHVGFGSEIPNDIRWKSASLAVRTCMGLHYCPIKDQPLETCISIQCKNYKDILLEVGYKDDTV